MKEDIGSIRTGIQGQSAVARMLPPESAAWDLVAREVGIGAGTLERWREDAQSKLSTPDYLSPIPPE